MASAALVACGAAAEPAQTHCRTLTFDTSPYVVCEAAPEQIRLVLNDAAGEPLGDFDAAQDALAPGETLLMAMNAGMYHADRRAVGLYRDAAGQAQSLMTQPGPGNFGMVPNGVFWVDGAVAGVTETLAYREIAREPALATQSGPMLVIDGTLHPRFLSDSESRKRRNGVGVSADGRTAYFAISDAPVNFHSFARLFRDGLGVPNALFLDGTVSRIRAPEIDRDERGGRLGPMVMIVEGEAPQPPDRIEDSPEGD